MALSAKALERATTALADSGYDVAAGMNEATLNDFFDAHWKVESASGSSIYKGEGKAAEIGISWSYDVRSPATIDLQPIQAATFAKIYTGWMNTVPELQRFVSPMKSEDRGLHVKGSLSAPPPNVQVQVKDLRLNIKTDSGIDVTFDYAITVTGFVETTLAGNTRILRITPISAKVTDPSAVRLAIDKALPPGAGVAGMQDCVELRRLILYIVNVLIANRVGSFVREFSLPVPIDIVSGVSLIDVEVQIIDDLLALMGRLGASSAASAGGAERDLLLYGSPDELKAEAARDKGAQGHAFARGEVLPFGAPADVTAWPARGLFVILHERLFQAVAGKLGVDVAQERCQGVFGFKACYGYSMRVWGATASVVNNGLNVAAQFTGSGWLKGCIETHCGDKCHKVGARAKADPKFAAEFAFKGRELWMAATPRMFDIDWDIDGLPWPLNKLVAWFLDIVSDAAVVLLRLLGAQWKTKLTSVPDEFPGTTIKCAPRFDSRIVKDPAQPALLILGEVDFLP